MCVVYGVYYPVGEIHDKYDLRLVTIEFKFQELKFQAQPSVAIYHSMDIHFHEEKT